MKDKTRFISVARGIECAVIGREPQARRTVTGLTPKASSFAQLAVLRGQRELRITLPPMPQRPLSFADRTALAALRAAELAQWQATGGDALRRTQAEPF